MDRHRLDRLAKTLATTGSRRRLLAGLLGTTLASIPVLRQPAASAARRRYSERKIKRIIREAARHYNQNPNAMIRVADCESNLDPYAYNRSGPYYGLFQFLRSTFEDTPYGDENIYDPRANARAAAWMWKKKMRDHWVCQ